MLAALPVAMTKLFAAVVVVMAFTSGVAMADAPKKDASSKVTRPDKKTKPAAKTKAAFAPEHTRNVPKAGGGPKLTAKKPAAKPNAR